MKFPFYKDLAFRLFCLTRFFLAHFALISLIIEQFIFASFSSALAADLPINVDGSTNTSIDRAANNVPIVNIAAPNSGGLSHNKFTDYNVNQRGLILNNATGGKNGFTQSQIGGLIQDNANLKNSGSARIILNEVTSNNISRINGYTEIAGGKADLIIANPNGISMAGAGFINASKLTAIVGSPNQLNPHPNNLTFSLSGNAYELTNGFLPQLTISGAGLDLESVSSTDLVANLMNIVSPIYGGSNDVNLRAGDQNFDYLTKAVSSDNSSIEAVPNSVAIDASALGKIQAGRIFIIATKEGFGVKYSGDLLASRSGITIDSQGNIAYNNIAAEVGDIDVKSHKGSIEQTGISQTKSTTSDITLNALGDITNLGQFLSARNINLETKASFSNQGSNLNLSDNDFIIEAVELNNLGKISAKNNLTITATSKLTNSKELVAGNILTITAPQIINEDSIYSNHQINITATDFLTNNKEIISLGDGLSNLDDGIYITAKSINNNKEISSKNNITINSNSLNNNLANSTILALKDINLNLRTLDNSSAKIQSGRKLTIKSNKSSSTPSSSFFASSSSSEDDEDSSSLSIFNSLGSLYGASSIDLDFGDIDDYTITGTIETSGSIEISAKNILNQGNVSATDFIKLTASNNFTNGFLNSDESFEDNANVKLAAGTYLEIVAANEVNNYATLSATTNLTITATNNNINNSGEYAKIIGGSGTATLNANNGSINNSILYQDSINQNYSFITSSNSLIANATSSNAKINAIASFFDDEGNLKDGYETLLSSSSTIKNFIKLLVDGEYKYTQISKSDAALTTKLNELYRIDNSEGGAIVANNDLILNAVNLNNYNRIDVANNFTINATNNLNNFASAMIYSGNEMKLNVVNSLNNYSDASLYSENNLTIQKHDESSSSYDSANNKINQLNNISANIISYGGNVNIEAESFVNERDYLPFQGAENLIYTAVWWARHGNHYNRYYRAEMQGRADKEAVISAGLNMVINATTLTNNSSSIYAKNDITINANSISNLTNIYRDYLAIRHWDHNYDGDYGDGDSSADNREEDDVGGYWYSGTKVVNKISYKNQAYTYGANIKAGRNLIGNIRSKIDNNYVDDDVADIQSPKDENGKIIASINAGAESDLLVIETNLSNYLSGPKNQGLFTKNQNPNAPLFETRSDFIDQSKFFGSDYFYTRIGLNLTDVQTEFEQQNKRLVGDQFFQTKIIEEQLRTISKNSLLLSSNEINVNNEIKSLLDNAADEYSRLGLAANNALTQTQINSLEKDIIWFETKTIDGSTYIVPTIYLSQTTRDNLKNGNLASKSTIFAKENVELTSSSGSIINGGSIVGNNVTLKANSNILNSNFSDITASNNLSLISDSGSIINKSDLSAKNDLSLTTLNGDIYNIATIKTNAKNLLDGDYSSDSSAYIRNNSGITNSGEINSTLVESANIKAGSVIINSSKNFTNLASNISTTKNTITNTSDGSTSTTDGNISITAGDNINIATLEERNRTIKVWGSKKKGGETTIDNTTNTSSEISSEGSLNIDSGNNVTLQAAKIESGDDININADNALLLTTATDSYFKQTKTHYKGTMTIRNSDSGFYKTDIINNEISSSNSGEINLTSGNITYLQYEKNSIKNALKESNINNTNNHNNYLVTLSKDQTTLKDPISEINKKWDTTTRGLSQTGTIIIAVTAAVATGGIGSFATVGAGMMTAGAGALATTATISGTNASMNGGGFGDTLKMTFKTALKDTTSRESLENAAVAAAAAGLTIGVSQATGMATNTTTTVASGSKTLTTSVSLSNSAANLSTSQRILTNLGTATARAGISTASYAISNSVIKGESITDSLKDQDGKMLAAQILGEVGAREIGFAAHNDKINQPLQLTLHAGLGATTAAITGNDILSGALAGAASEYVAQTVYENGVSANNAIISGQVTGAATSLLASSIQGNSDEQVAKDIQLGGMIGANAAANNATYVDKNRKIVDVDKKDKDTGIYIDNQDGGTRKDELIGQTEYVDEFIVPETGKIYDDAYITKTDITPLIKNLSAIGGGSVNQTNPIETYIDLKQLSLDSHPYQKFDIKNTILNPFDGYILNGYYVTGRSGGNYLAGSNAAIAKPAYFTNNFWLNETLTRAGNLHNSGKLGSEIPYAIRQITRGYENNKK
jgi:filamentous hemagglutinin